MWAQTKPPTKQSSAIWDWPGGSIDRCIRAHVWWAIRRGLHPSAFKVRSIECRLARLPGGYALCFVCVSGSFTWSLFLLPDLVGSCVHSICGCLGGFLLMRASHLHPRSCTLSASFSPPFTLVGEHFGKKADVYAFGIILNELVTVHHPFENARVTDKRQLGQLILAGTRPSIPDDCMESCRQLMLDCFDENPDHRPSFAVIVRRMEYILEELAPQSSRLASTTRAEAAQAH
jgi:Protein tyrosine and serine/threonine kinase